MKLIARLPDWTDCHLVILGIGDMYLFGKIVDTKEPWIVRVEDKFDKDQPWIIELSDDKTPSLN